MDSSQLSVLQSEHTVKGSVLDKNNTPLIGVNVIEKGTSNGTITDFDGNFTLRTSTANPVLVFSYVGFTSKEVTASASAPVKVVLSEDTETLEEVVVVGYGTQKKANLSGSVASVDSEQLQNRPIQNVSSGLQGLMPGVTVTGTNGAPGQDAGN